MNNFIEITPDVFIDTRDVSGVEFKNAVWGRDKHSKIVLASTRTRVIVHLVSGSTMAFELPDDLLPEDIMERLDMLPEDCSDYE